MGLVLPKEEPGPLGDVVVSRIGEGVQKMSSQILVPESKEVSQTKPNSTAVNGVYQPTQSQLEDLPMI